MIGHQHVRMDLAAVCSGRIMELYEISEIVLLAEEAGLPIVTALDNVLWNTGDMESRLAGHGVVDGGGKLYLRPRHDSRQPARAAPLRR